MVYVYALNSYYHRVLLHQCVLFTIILYPFERRPAALEIIIIRVEVEIP